MALRIALDVNRYVDVARDDAYASDVLRRASEIAIPFPVLAELRAGFRLGSRPTQNEAILQRFLQTERVGVLFADEGTTHVYAEIFAELRRAGTPIPTNDVWLAAIAIQHGLAVFSRDAHFDRIPRLARVS